MAVTEEAYQCYLEAAMGKDRCGLQYLSEMYWNGVYVSKDIKRAEELINMTGDLELVRYWKIEHKLSEGERI